MSLPSLKRSLHQKFSMYSLGVPMELSVDEYIQITQLMKENKSLKKKVRRLERNEQKNKVLLENQKATQSNNINFIRNQIKKSLDLALHERGVSLEYRLEKTNTAPIKVRRDVDIKKEEIFNNTEEIKIPEITAPHDRTDKQRQEYKRLEKYLSIFRRNDKNHCFILNNNLFVNSKKYSLQELDNYFELKTFQRQNQREEFHIKTRPIPLKKLCSNTLERNQEKNKVLLENQKATQYNNINFKRNQIKKSLDLALHESDISQEYRLEKTNTEVTIPYDRTDDKQRQEYKRLEKYLSIFRRNDKNHCFIHNNRLVVNGKMFSLQELDNYFESKTFQRQNQREKFHI